MTQQLNTNTVSALPVLYLVSKLIDAKAMSESDICDDFPEISQIREKILQQTTGFNIEEMRLEEKVLLKLWQMSTERPEANRIGLAMGSKVSGQTNGFLANWISQCENLGEACDVFRNNISLKNPSEKWTLDVKEKTIEFTFSFTNTNYPTAAYENSMAMFITTARYLSQRDISVLSASFCHAKPSKINDYKEIFGEYISFSSAVYSIVLKKEVSLYSIPAASAYLKKLLEQKAEHLLRTFPDNLSQTVYELIANNPVHFKHIEATCDALHMSRSKLYRQLKKEGTSYSELVDKMRAAKSLDYKSNGEKDSYIAEQLGFQDSASYYKARKRWRALAYLGVTPESGAGDI